MLFLCCCLDSERDRQRCRTGVEVPPHGRPRAFLSASTMWFFMSADRTSCRLATRRHHRGHIQCRTIQLNRSDL